MSPNLIEVFGDVIGTWFANGRGSRFLVEPMCVAKHVLMNGLFDVHVAICKVMESKFSRVIDAIFNSLK